MLAKMFIEKKFKEYYSKSKIKLPKDFEKREFAFVPFSSLPEFIMHRHLAFKSEEDFQSYVLKNLPAHVYYSSAYYENPAETSMDKKGWLAADLVFDIDADHLPLKIKSIESSLKMAKREVKKLLTILKRDFGINEEDTKVYFSGGRGYHIHVTSEDFLELGSAERREIVDYLTINNPDLRLDSTIRRRIEAYVKRFSSTIEVAIEKLRVYVDAPVTADTKRLIRMPGTLHGKTGLAVVEVEDVEIFDPLSDAVVFGDEEVSVRVLKKVTVRIKDVNVRAKPGDVIKVPEYAAIFLLCRGLATY
ncbi:MAG: DNA primase catalytic subunit PriS [Archaeoglobales archaeon]|nr:DNA primase catalytic subunit PriS [Archaeoglobales archaeon]